MVAVDPDDPLPTSLWSSSESVRILRRRGELIISETSHGFVCADAGIDLSNVERGHATLCRTTRTAPPAASATACATAPGSRSV